MQSAAVAGQRGIGANHAMARNDDGNRIGAVCEADRTDRFGMPDLAGESTVAERAAGGNCAQCRPDDTLKGRAVCFSRQFVDRVKIAFKIRQQCPRSR